MKENEDPNHFYDLYINGKIDLNQFLDYMLMIIEKSDNLKYRTRSLEILIELDIEINDIFNFIENILVSDEDYQIRALSFIYLVKKNSQRAQRLLKWAILNDSSTFFLRKIKDYIDPKESPLLFSIYSQKINQYSKILQLDPLETRFLIDLGVELNSLSIILTNFEIHYIRNETLLIMVKDNYIRELNLVLRLNELPNSIGNLKKLENLNLAYNDISSLPNNIKNLDKLKILDLSWNNFYEIPMVIKDLHSLRVLNLDHNFIIEQPEEFDTLTNKIRISLENNPVSIK